MDVHLALPAEYAATERIVRDYDDRLRLRKSVDLPEYYVLEIRSLKGCPVDPTEKDGRDLAVAAADNYLHISYVHPSFLSKPWRILEELKAHDLWRHRGAAVVEREMVQEDADRKERARRTRRDWLHHTAREAFDILNRTGGVGGTEVSRWNNPGIVPASRTGDPATLGGFDETVHSSTVDQDDQLHRQPGG